MGKKKIPYEVRLLCAETDVSHHRRDLMAPGVLQRWSNSMRLGARALQGWQGISNVGIFQNLSETNTPIRKKKKKSISCLENVYRMTHRQLMNNLLLGCPWRQECCVPRFSSELCSSQEGSGTPDTPKVSQATWLRAILRQSWWCQFSSKVSQKGEEHHQHKISGEIWHFFCDRNSRVNWGMNLLRTLVQNMY